MYHVAYVLKRANFQCKYIPNVFSEYGKKYRDKRWKKPWHGTFQIRWPGSCDTFWWRSSAGDRFFFQQLFCIHWRVWTVEGLLLQRLDKIFLNIRKTLWKYFFNYCSRSRIAHGCDYSGRPYPIFGRVLWVRGLEIRVLKSCFIKMLQFSSPTINENAHLQTFG